jgi:hypothetical protein
VEKAIESIEFRAAAGEHDARRVRRDGEMALCERAETPEAFVERHQRLN